MQIVDAYLTLHPSTLPASIEDTPAQHAIWIRDEMRRLLEYAQRDLGYAQVTPQLTAPDEWRAEAQRSLQSFAALRGTFYGVGSGEAFTLAARAADTVDPVKQQAWLQARADEFQQLVDCAPERCGAAPGAGHHRPTGVVGVGPWQFGC